MDSILKKLSIITLLLFLTSNVYSTPSTSMSIPNSFTPNTTIQSGQVNANNNEISSKYNSHTHTDITQVGTITSGTWAGSVISTQFGGTGQDFSGGASGAIIYFSGTGATTTLAKASSGTILITDANTLGPNWLTQGASGQVLRSNGDKANPSWTNAGKVVQVVNVATGAVLTGTTAFPTDDNIPTQNNGNEFMNLTMTPTSSSNKLRIDVVFYGSPSGGDFLTMALYQDTTLNALAADSVYQASAGGTVVIPLSHYMTAGTTSPITFKVRAGITAGATTTFNGAAGARKQGGVANSSITVTEIQNP